jgi:hypothetical protein
MALAGAVVVLALVVMSAIGWKTIGRWLAPEPAVPPRPIVFDNGSVRDQPASAPPAKAARPRPAVAAPGQLRKCLLPGGSVSYSNLACPPGAREAAVRSDGVTVLPSGLPAGQPGAAATPPAGGTRPLQPGETLQQRAIERAIEQSTR